MNFKALFQSCSPSGELPDKAEVPAAHKHARLFTGGLPWRPSSYDSELPMQEAWVSSVVGELDPTYCN